MTAIKRTDSGFSIIEVLVAIIILSVGLLALAQSSGTVSRMVGRGNQDTQAAMAAQARLEGLRQLANSTNPKCTSSSLVSGSAAGTLPITSSSWTVATNPDGTRSVDVSVSYRIGRSTPRTVVVQAILGCL
jgi:type IV pilus modification protein PilV